MARGKYSGPEYSEMKKKPKSWPKLEYLTLMHIDALKCSQHSIFTENNGKLKKLVNFFLALDFKIISNIIQKIFFLWILMFPKNQYREVKWIGSTWTIFLLLADSNLKPARCWQKVNVEPICLNVIHWFLGNVAEYQFFLPPILF